VSRLESDQETIGSLKRDARKLNSASINTLADETLYIDVANIDVLSASEKKALLDVFRQRWGAPAKWHISKDTDFLRFFAPTVDAAMEYPHTNVIAYNSDRLREAQMDLEVSLAHELGHKAIGRGYVAVTGKNEESAADQFAALVTSPQRVVDMLRNVAQFAPENNAIPLPEKADRHPTAYERAMAIAKSFPGQVNLQGFPAPSSPSTTVNGIAEPVPVVPSPLPSYLRPSAPAPGMR
jgi:hypothetical protein